MEFEAAHWVRSERPIIVVVTAGDTLNWTYVRSALLPPSLASWFVQEPVVVDLRGQVLRVRSDGHGPAVRGEITESLKQLFLAFYPAGTTWEFLRGQERRQRRVVLTWLASIALTLLTATTLAVTFAYIARQRSLDAQRETRRANRESDAANTAKGEALVAATKATAAQARAENGEAAAKEQQTRSENLLGGLAHKNALQQLQAGDPAQAIRVLELTPTSTRTIVGQVTRSEAVRLSPPFAGEDGGRYTLLFEPDGSRVLMTHAYENIHYLTSVDDSALIVEFDRRTAFGVKPLPNDKSDLHMFCMVHPGKEDCRPLFPIHGEPIGGSVDPSGQFLSFTDKQQWWLVSRGGSAIDSLEGVSEAHWLDSTRLVMLVGSQVRFYTPRSKVTRRVPELGDVRSISIGRAGVLAAIRERGVLLFSYHDMKIVGGLRRAVADSVFSWSGRRFAALSDEGHVSMYALERNRNSNDGGNTPSMGDSKPPDSPLATDPDRTTDLESDNVFGAIRLVATSGEGEVSEDGRVVPYSEMAGDLDVSKVRFSRDDSTLLVSGPFARLAGSLSLRMLRKFELYGGAPIVATFFGRDDRIGLSAPWSGGFDFANHYSTKGVKTRLVFRKDAEYAAFSTDGERILLATLHGVQVVGLDGTQIHTISRTDREVHTDFSLSNGTSDIVVFQGHTLSRWVLNTAKPSWKLDLPGPELGELVSGTEPAHRVPAVLGPVWSPDGRWIGIGIGRELLVLNAADGRIVGRSKTGGRRTIRFTSDSRQLRMGWSTFTNGTNQHVLVEDIFGVPSLKRSGQEDLSEDFETDTPEQRSLVTEKLRGLRGDLEGFTIPAWASVNGCLKLSTADGYVSVLADDREPILTLEGFDEPPHVAALHPASRFVLAVSGSQASLWDLGVDSAAVSCRADH
jgi:sRNA-binding protein